MIGVAGCWFVWGLLLGLGEIVIARTEGRSILFWLIGKERFGFSHVTLYIRIMATKKANIITIDLDVWTTQTKKAKSLTLNESTIRQRVSRTRQNKGLIKEEFWDIPELDLTLVKKEY